MSMRNGQTRDFAGVSAYDVKIDVRMCVVKRAEALRDHVRGDGGARPDSERALSEPTEGASPRSA
jgi:hypothetical protein